MPVRGLPLTGQITNDIGWHLGWTPLDTPLLSSNMVPMFNFTITESMLLQFLVHYTEWNKATFQLAGCWFSWASDHRIHTLCSHDADIQSGRLPSEIIWSFAKEGGLQSSQTEVCCSVFYPDKTEHFHLMCWWLIVPADIFLCWLCFSNTGKFKHLCWKCPGCRTLHHLSAHIHCVCYLWPQTYWPEGFICFGDWLVCVCWSPFCCKYPTLIQLLVIINNDNT